MKKNINFAVQSGGAEYQLKDVEDAVKDKIKEKGFRMKDIDSIDVYLKPEEGKAYYVVHDADRCDMDNGCIELD